MRQVITAADIPRLIGRYILQLNSDDNKCLTDKKVDVPFYLEKRISFVSYGMDGIVLIGLYGNNMAFTNEAFVEYFNNYLGDSKGTRFHRLLYTDELELVFKFIKSRNY